MNQTHSRIYSRIAGTGSYLPARKMTNAELEKIVDTTDDWIRERTGIESRHIAADDQATSDLAYEASLRALKNAGIAAEEIDAILVATVTPDHSLPNTACLLQSRLGCRAIMAVDLSAACSGFLYALSTADHLIRGGGYKNILVVGAETLSRIIDWKDRQTCILFGDGAGAFVLSRSTDPGAGAILSASLAAEGDKASLLRVPAGGSRKPYSQEVLDQREAFVQMQGREIFKAAVTTLRDVSLKALAECEKRVEDADLFFVHQANQRIVEALAKQLDLGLDKVPCNVSRVGNTSSASIPILFDECVQSGLAQRGQLYVFAAFGAGLTSGALVVRY